MDTRNTDRFEDYPSVETPEDVAVLYSWANLHGAKYRDFSASRREYRAQLRHRAAEQARDQELQAQAEAEAAAYHAEEEGRRAQELAQEAEMERELTLQRAEEAARVAAAERIEAARRAEAAALAEADALRERREIAEANAAARRQASQYAESDSRRRYATEYEDAELPGRISDPYTPASRSASPPPADVPEPPQANDAVELHPTRYRTTPERPAEREWEPTMSYDQHAAPELTQEPWQPNDTREVPATPVSPARRATSPTPSTAPRRPQGYRPDDASGVREIYRGPGSSGSAPVQRPSPAASSRPVSQPAALSSQHSTVSPRTGATAPRSADLTHRRTIWAGSPEERSVTRSTPISRGGETVPVEPAARTPTTPRRRRTDYLPDPRIDSGSGPAAAAPRERQRTAPPESSSSPARSTAGQPWKDGAAPPSVPKPQAGKAQQGDAVAPAWIYAPRATEEDGDGAESVGPTPPSVADTLQQSRERVASRWYALKGVFEQPGQPRPEPQPVRQKETRTPVLAVFSLAGGVGKTALVATLGRALSSMGEKALLTDTTSHGLLPFYFGASELRQGAVRTFSPPSGSTDAPIYLVSYDVDGQVDEEAQEALVEEIAANGRGTHRVLLDLSVGSSWLLRRITRLSPTVLVPVAPDMNSVISLAGVEKFFRGMTDAEGAPIKIFYVLNQFDASLPLHLDVREVLRRQLGDKLLPFVIRRAPVVSEALAEGMTVIDYAPDVPVSEDYLNVATWLRSHAAPATTGFRSVRWSER